MNRRLPIQAVGRGTWPLDKVSTGHRRITACLASIRKGEYRQTKCFTSAFIQRIETGYAEKRFLKVWTKAPTSTWISESFFQTERGGTFARQLTPLARYLAISLHTSGPRGTYT